ncbi:MAG: hypothetical protein D6722_01850, partial [Bacteroidetes bacterium]
MSAQALVEFINQCPFGLIQTDKNGKVLMVNAFASQLLFPVAILHGQSLENCWDLLEEIAPELRARVLTYEPNYGPVCENERVGIPLPEPTPTLYLSFSIIRLGADSYQVAFKDVNNTVKAEEEAKAATAEAATQAGKAEMASGILHDIGNAVTAFGSHTAKLHAMGNWDEIASLTRLKSLFEAKETAIEQALGAGKGAALLKFVGAIEAGLIQRQQAVQGIGQQLLEVTSHIQDILNIQRHYVKGREAGTRSPIRLISLLEDALVIVGRSFEKRRVTITQEVPYHLPEFSGDRTKLIQVLINLFKNAAEAFDEVQDERDRRLHISGQVVESDGELELVIKDNAIGAAPESLEQLFAK